jgi:hypothetical protein
LPANVAEYTGLAEIVASEFDKPLDSEVLMLYESRPCRADLLEFAQGEVVWHTFTHPRDCM